VVVVALSVCELLARTSDSSSDDLMFVSVSSVCIPGRVLESPDQKTRGFLVPIALPW
jgi:hypothetical protein